jgi:biopolymer transport protein ExbD
MDMDMDDEDSGYYAINVAPLVDVALVLVLVFMVTTPFLTKKLMPVKLPEAVVAEAEARENVTISISPDEGYAVNEVPVKRSDLIAAIKSKMAESNFSFVLIRADERVPHSEVAFVMKISKQLGVKRIAFATLPKGR